MMQKQASKEWQAERNNLMQKIDLLESTIGEMKERQSKIKRINDTLLHSLSTNSENKMSSSGLRHVMIQQSAELARLHRRLKDQQIFEKKASSKSIMKRVMALQERFKQEQNQNSSLADKSNIEKAFASSVNTNQLNSRIRVPRQQSVGLRVEELQKNSPRMPLKPRVSAKDDDKSVLDTLIHRFKLKTKSVQCHQPLNGPICQDVKQSEFKPLQGVPRFNNSILNHHLKSTSSSEEMNIAGYVNFLKANPQSLNYQLLEIDGLPLSTTKDRYKK